MKPFTACSSPASAVTPSSATERSTLCNRRCRRTGTRWNAAWSRSPCTSRKSTSGTVFFWWGACRTPRSHGRFQKTEAYRLFLDAYARAREWVRTAPPEEVAAAEASFFPLIAPEFLTAAIRLYQALGCWEGGLEIPRELYEQALNVFQATGTIAWRHRYDEVVG